MIEIVHNKNKRKTYEESELLNRTTYAKVEDSFGDSIDIEEASVFLVLREFSVLVDLATGVEYCIGHTEGKYVEVKVTAQIEEI